MVVGGLSVALVVVTEGITAFSLSTPEMHDYLFELTTTMTLLAVFIVGALVWRLFHKALWMVREATESVDCLTRRGELILNSAAEAIWVVDQDGETTFLNPAAEKVTGWTLDEVQGKHQHELLRHSNSEGIPFEASSCPVCKAIQQGIGHFAPDDVFWKKDGTNFPVEYHSTPIHESGKIVGAALYIQKYLRASTAPEQARPSAEAGIHRPVGRGHRPRNQHANPVRRRQHPFLKDAFKDFHQVMTAYEQLAKGLKAAPSRPS